jgi:hypothetical protein
VNREREQSPITIHRSLITHRDFFGATASGFIVVAFCLLLLWHDPLLFWNDDYQLSILPVFADVARSWSEGHLPLLSPYSWVCSNLAGEFQYGTFSVFVNAAVVIIWKFPLTFAQQAAALSITHLFVLAIGGFLLARGRAFSIPLSIFVAIVAALNGWIICWGAIDWFGALGAFAWLPWAWWGLERALDGRRSRWRFLWPAPFVYLVVTGGFPYTVLMLLLLIAWLSIKSLGEMWERPPWRAVAWRRRQRRDYACPARTRDTKVPLTLSILPMLFGAALGFGLSAPAWLAILDYVHGSARGVEAASAHWQWIVPPTALPALILPCWTVNWADFSTRYMPHTATEMACGLVAPVALISGLILRGRLLVRQIGWELTLLALVLVIAMLPSAGVFRWSFRWLPFFHLILAICAAEALRSDMGFPRHAVVPRLRDEGGQPMFMPMPRQSVLALLLVGVTTITMSILGTIGDYAFPLTWIFLGLVAVWTLAEFFFVDSNLRAWIPACVTFAALLSTYLCISPNCGVPKYNLSQELSKPAPLDPERLYLSIYPPAEHTYRIEKKPGPVGQIVRPGSTSMWAGLHFINGYSPILAAGVAREFKFAIHGEIDPEMGKYLLEQQAGGEGQLGKLGVDGIAIAREVKVNPEPSSEWQLAAQTDEGRVFHRTGSPSPRVRSVTSIDSRPDERFASAMVSRMLDSRNRMELDVDVPSGGRSALLTFSRPYFPGYQARLGETKLVVDSYRGLMPTVEVPAGSSGRLVLSYRPRWFVYGGGLSIFCAALFLIASLFAAREKRPE